MSNKDETSPLEARARAAYNPTNGELMAELHRQNQVSHAILAQALKTNGRVGVLEVDVAPLKAWYNKFKVIAAASLLVCPVIFTIIMKICDLLINRAWPSH